MGGNALDFLKKKEDGQQRRGHHNRVCNEKIDKFLKDNETTKCEDYCIIQVGNHRKSHRVNETRIFMGTIDGIHARMFAKRQPKPCACCEQSFTPRKLRRPSSKREKALGMGEFTIWCGTCTRKGTVYRTVIKNVGGYERFVELKKLSMLAEDISKLKSLRLLYEQRDLKLSILQQVGTVDKTIAKVIEKAYKEHEYFITKNSHYDFDF